ncbi:MAG: glycosyltransferase family 2 protein [Acaryochloris sp. RU_4_1]|nr:glycosyltransferase family 2 protein [Acaryochloris sp. RU_4_1]NJR53212.1 glycosyltransferase family 2 protein [Acaryochloris sp. CRU_2_0]
MDPFPAFDLPPLSPQPLVSVVINNYNYGRFLDHAIASVLAQTYPHIELIVVDDGSTDESTDVIQAYGDQITPILQSNGGQGVALTVGIAQAQGEIICLLDADDYFHPQKVARVVAEFQEHPTWVQLSHPWTLVNTEGLSLEHQPQKTLATGDVRPLLCKYGKYRSALTSALAYRQTVLAQVLPMPELRTCADAYLMATVPFYGPVGQINDPLMFYRLHGGNLHGSTLNLSHHIWVRQMIVTTINEMAIKMALSQTCNIELDADYRTFSALQRRRISWAEAVQIMGMSLSESIGIGRSPKETLIRVLWGSICLLCPDESQSVLQHGLHEYLHGKRSPKPVVPSGNDILGT